ncbi:MAG: hypothetical protein V2A34_03885 [Lentisphaerota bacterium]
MESSIVVTSWWSNCLALTSLRQLVAFAPGRKLYVMQAGKSDLQMARFRALLPGQVTELHYPPHLLTDDSPMREYLAREVFRSSEGVWFVDHDTFFLAGISAWLDAADAIFDSRNICICTRTPHLGAGVTQPAYWLSPGKWPQGLSSFDPIPFQPKPYTRRPDLHRHKESLAIPGKDTLVQVWEELEARQMAGTFPLEEEPAGNHLLPAFPSHQHLGGLHVYTGWVQPPASMPQAFFDWRRHVVSRFEEFFQSCPPEWMEIEEPELLRRHEEFKAAIHEAS